MDRSFRRNSLILIGSLGAILVVYMLLFWVPLRRQSAALAGEVLRKRNEIDYCMQQATQTAALQAELELVGTTNRHAMALLPPALNVKEFLAQVHGLGQQAGITISSVTPGIISDVVNVQQQPVSLTLVGQFHPIMRLLYALETMDRLVEISELDIRSLEQRQSQVDTLEVKLTVRLYARPAKSADPVKSSG